MCENMAECVKLISLSVPVTGGEGRRVVTPAGGACVMAFIVTERCVDQSEASTVLDTGVNIPAG